ncbi:DNA-protecting protein DprA [Aquihabitans sp. G128]|uniref:DNA-processing protein DprA n=1 Tax=Aquihabitans sp. G128 TaxID=2849779 RepID=UPI001C24BB48|nr:DNA-processing protein DprA [Aquihabitans sp. G128]QXC62613.1 DNA-protecting protein DprA [Aquihabitans sp. G128]
MSAEDLAVDDLVAAHLVALASVSGIGPATLLRCHQEEGAVEAWAALVAGAPERVAALGALLRPPRPVAKERLVHAARQLDPGSELARHRAAGRLVLVLGQPGYPQRLAEDPAPPAILFASGGTAALTGPAVAVVGTRNATRAGRELARAWCEELALVGVAIVSGLALGIDGAAHEGALRALAGAGLGAGPAPGPAVPEPGRPIGVVASGLDVVYPRRHVDLHRNVEAAGVVLSEVPLGERPTTWRFPARNRIIAGLADAVLVVESRVTGGSILTAGEALDRSTPVLAVPGHPSSRSAAGTNDLLFDGAAIARSPTDVLDAIGLAPAAVRPSATAGEVGGASLSPDQRTVLAALDEQPAALPEVVGRTGLSIEAVSGALLHLEAQGHLARVGGWYERTRPYARRAPGGGR